MLIFTDILAVAKVHEIPWHQYFTDVKISDIAAGRSDISYIIELNHMLQKHLLFQANDIHIYHFK